jgi:hypothetical protein
VSEVYVTELYCADCTMSVSDLASALPPTLGIVDGACCCTVEASSCAD